MLGMSAQEMHEAKESATMTGDSAAYDQLYTRALFKEYIMKVSHGVSRGEGEVCVSR